MKHAAPSTTRPRWQFLAAPLVALAVAAPVVVGAATTTITRSEAQAAADTLAAYLAQPEPTVTVTETVTATPSAVPTVTPTPTPTPTTASPTPTPTVPASGLIPFRPPTLTNPVTITIPATGGTFSAPSTTDCLFVSTAVIVGPVTLNGCRHRVWIDATFGGRTTVPTGSYDSTHRGVRVYDTTSANSGTDWFEGWRFLPGTYLSDAVQLAYRSTTGRTAYLINTRVDATTIGSQAGVHADTLQAWGGPQTLHVWGLTATRAGYQGAYLDQCDGRTCPPLGEPWTFDRVNIVGLSTARYLFADRRPANTRLTAADAWIYGSPYNNADSFGNAPAGVKVGTVADFVPASLWADGYVSPGYV